MHASLEPSTQDHYHFVTGKLAEGMLRRVIEPLAATHRFSYSIEVMPITVAALMTPAWVGKRLRVPSEATHVIVPGYLEQGLEELASKLEVPLVLGPKDCRALPELFGGAPQAPSLTAHRIEIIAEINHVPRLSVDAVVEYAAKLRDDGADVIDVGCDPASRCRSIAAYVAALVQEGHRVSIDSFDAWEVEQAIDAGATLVLSVNSSNRHLACEWGVPIVAIPDSPADQASLWETIEFLSDRDVAFAIDPILEPIGTGFARSLGRYLEIRKRYPGAAMMMGIGNLTELTDADSAGINLVLIAICEELRIESVLTTQVINWARTSVRECDAARRICHYAVENQVPPKRISDDLVMLRDPKLMSFSREALDQLADSVKDHHYRIFADQDSLHLVSRQMRLAHHDPFALFDALLEQPISENVDAAHAFYLGFELAKATIARTLGKQYTQDESLRWGFLSEPERYHRLKRSSRRKPS